MPRRGDSPSNFPTITLLCSYVGVVILFVQLGVLFLLPPVRKSSFKTSSIEKNSPVILLGLPRSGSLAIHDYFQCHGWKSAHYCCGGTSTKFPCLKEQTCGDCVLKNLKGHRPAFVECGDGQVLIWSQFDVETADAWFLPQHFALGLLHQAYPNATWILNTRGSAREWAESVFHWHSMTRRFLTTFGLPVEPLHAMTIPPPSPDEKVTPREIEVDMQRQLDARVYNQTEHLRKFALLQRTYDNHTATIYHWAYQFQSHPFLHINVDDASSSLKLLDQVFDLNSASKKCQWTFQSPTEDWKDFAFPFGRTSTPSD